MAPATDNISLFQGCSPNRQSHKVSPELRQYVPLLTRCMEAQETRGELSLNIMWNCWLLTCKSSSFIWFNLMHLNEWVSKWWMDRTIRSPLGCFSAHFYRADLKAFQPQVLIVWHERDWLDDRVYSLLFVCLFVLLLLFFESTVFYPILKKQIHSLSSPQSASNQLQSGSAERTLRSKEVRHGRQQALPLGLVFRCRLAINGKFDLEEESPWPLPGDPIGNN